VEAPRVKKVNVLTRIARNVIGRFLSKRQFRPLFHLTLARMRELCREPGAIFWAFGLPIFLALALGIAFRDTTPEKLRVAIERTDSSSSSLDSDTILNALSLSHDIQVVGLSPAEATQALRSGQVVLVVRMTQYPVVNNNGKGTASRPDGKQSLLSSPSGSGLQAGNHDPSLLLQYVFSYRYDPARSESRTARFAVDSTLQQMLNSVNVISTRDEKVSEPGSRYIDFLIPGLIGLNIMGSGMWGVGIPIVLARRQKLLKLLATTPMRRSHYLLSMMFSRLTFLVLEVIVVASLGWIMFGVSIRGSLLSFIIISLLGAATFTGFGLLVAARLRTIEALSGLRNVIMLPMWLLSGTFFSYFRYPQPLRPFIKALPLTALNDSLRAVINDGAPLLWSWKSLSVLCVWTIISFLLALWTFRWH
jgi:ABC-type multidrug transport system permease subunit